MRQETSQNRLEMVTSYVRDYKPLIKKSREIQGRLYEEYILATLQSNNRTKITLNGISSRLYNLISSSSSALPLSSSPKLEVHIDGKIKTSQTRRGKPSSLRTSSKETPKKWVRKDGKGNNMTDKEDLSESSINRHHNVNDNSSYQSDSLHLSSSYPSTHIQSIEDPHESTIQLTVNVQEVVSFHGDFGKYLRTSPPQYPNSILYVPMDPSYPIVDGFLRSSVGTLEILICIQITVSSPQNHSSKKQNLGRCLLIQPSQTQNFLHNQTIEDQNISNIWEYERDEREVYFVWITPNRSHTILSKNLAESEELTRIGLRQSMLYLDDDWVNLIR